MTEPTTSHSLHIINLTGMVYGGNAMGRLPDGRAVFVPFGMEGETVQVEIIEEKRGHAIARLVNVIKPSSERITPRCVHFGVCGGCHYQHMPYERQLLVKTGVVREQLTRIGGVDNPPVRPVVGSPNEWYYRNTVQFQITSDGRLGYYKQQEHEVFPIRECHLPEGPINETWPQLDMEAVPLLERVELRLDGEDQVLMVLESEDPQAPEFEVEMPISAVHMGPDGPVVLSGNDYITLDVMGRTFLVSAPSFFQVNTRQAEAMVQHLLDNLNLQPKTILLDLYCGVGLFSTFMAGRVGEVIGVELSPWAVQDFATNLQEFENVSIYEGAAAKVLPNLQVQPDIAIVDPPRAGLERDVLDALVRMSPATIAYVSCDPSTLARDVKRLLAAGYHLEQVMPFDLFPQTFHIETISILKR